MGLFNHSDDQPCIQRCLAHCWHALKKKKKMHRFSMWVSVWDLPHSPVACGNFCADLWGTSRVAPRAGKGACFAAAEAGRRGQSAQSLALSTWCPEEGD